MILLHEKNITAKFLADRFSVSVRTIQRDIDILSVAGIPVTSSKGPSGGYSLMDNYKLDKTFLKKDEMRILTDLLTGLENLLSQVGFRDIKEKVNAITKDESCFSAKIRFDFMPWLPHHKIQDKLIQISEAIESNRLIEIQYRDQKGKETLRKIEPCQLVMKDYAWYLYGYCMNRKDFRYFKVMRIGQFKLTEESFEPRQLPDEEPFADLQDKLINIKLLLRNKAIGRADDYFPVKDIKYEKDFIIVQTQYPDDIWLQQVLLSFGKDVEVLEPEHLKEQIKQEAQKMFELYS